VIVFDADRIGPWVCRRAGGAWIPGRGTAIGKEKAGELVAGVLYEDWNGANIVCHIAGEGAWANREFLRVIFDYPFNQLKVRRITVPVASVNHISRRFVEHLGFELETTLADAHPEGDILLYRITPDKCRWLRGQHGKE
jgi:RimJ/RimL family protein N-acetyltransferase